MALRLVCIVRKEDAWGRRARMAGEAVRIRLQAVPFWRGLPDGWGACSADRIFVKEI